MRPSFRRIVALGLATALLHLALIQPNHPAAATWAALALVPLELPVILLAFVALPREGGITVAARAALVVTLTVIVLLKTADFAAFTALGRAFNPVSDLPLIGASLRLLDGAAGALTAVAGVAGAGLAVALVAAGLWWATGCWVRVAPPRAARAAAASGSVLALGIATAEIGQASGRWTLPATPPGAAFSARVGLERIALVRDTLRDLQTFDRAAREDPFVGRDGLLGAIDRDVLVIFVESYGRASLEGALYAPTHRPTLAAAEAKLDARGLAMRSGWLTAPTRGGQSWLSHATFANGLWISDQRRHAALLASARESLFHIARRSGFHTAAIMPAVTLDWPESLRMGFDTVLAVDDLGYRGAPFNWVTMPDQFTLAALDRLLRPERDRQKLFAQVALISSHAPWVPVPPMLDWDALGDGRVFDTAALSGPSPEEVWRDRDRVRDQYRQAVDYALRTVMSYAHRHAEDPPLLIVVGDHQAAPFVAQDDRADVPVHIIGPSALVDRVSDWGWTDGLLPDAGAPVWRMDDVRDALIEAFSLPPARGAEGRS